MIALFPIWDIAIFHENAWFKKNLFSALGQTSHQNRKKENPLESIGALFSMISKLL